MSLFFLGNFQPKAIAPGDPKESSTMGSGRYSQIVFRKFYGS
ncbi:hypothetical protein SYNPCC7002_A2725 [Picosynechococcus sp. PCC 7002]|nr:hypothetical protein SYNPCC7002_A2725 [Picosynechococcus sp. PCC 7002]